jgi:hypothetical protein
VNVGANDGHVVLFIRDDEDARVRVVDRSAIDEKMVDECDEGGREMIDLQAVVPRIAGLDQVTRERVARTKPSSHLWMTSGYHSRLRHCARERRADHGFPRKP